MPVSEVKICNMALTMIGASSIISLTQDNENARKCNTLYEHVRDTILRDHRWNFAINRATLAQSSDPPAYDYGYAYELPTDPYCLRVLELYEEIDKGEEFEIEGRTIVTDSTTARIKYIGRVTDPAQFDEYFVDAFAARLAAELAFPVTNSRTLQQQLLAVYEEKMDRAYLANAVEGKAARRTEPRDDDGSWLSVR